MRHSRCVTHIDFHMSLLAVSLILRSTLPRFERCIATASYAARRSVSDTCLVMVTIKAQLQRDEKAMQVLCGSEHCCAVILQHGGSDLRHHARTTRLEHANLNVIQTYMIFQVVAGEQTVPCLCAAAEACLNTWRWDSLPRARVPAPRPPAVNDIIAMITCKPLLLCEGQLRSDPVFHTGTWQMQAVDSFRNIFLERQPSQTF